MLPKKNESLSKLKPSAQDKVVNSKNNKNQAVETTVVIAAEEGAVAIRDRNLLPKRTDRIRSFTTSGTFARCGGLVFCAIFGNHAEFHFGQSISKRIGLCQHLNRNG